MYSVNQALPRPHTRGALLPISSYHSAVCADFPLRLLSLSHHTHTVNYFLLSSQQCLQTSEWRHGSFVSLAGKTIHKEPSRQLKNKVHQDTSLYERSAER